MVRELAAERSGCRWCLDRVRHDWRIAGLPVDLLRRLDRHASEAGLTECERAARARRHFSERAMAELIACMAEHHLIADEST